MKSQFEVLLQNAVTAAESESTQEQHVLGALSSEVQAMREEQAELMDAVSSANEAREKADSALETAVAQTAAQQETWIAQVETWEEELRLANEASAQKDVVCETVQAEAQQLYKELDTLHHQHVEATMELSVGPSLHLSDKVSNVIFTAEHVHARTTRHGHILHKQKWCG
jgi:chromosome segregation ATPase